MEVEKRSARSLKMEAIANEHPDITNNIVNYIYKKLNIDLYKEYKSKDNIDLKKNKAFYKQVIQRLLRSIERNTNKKYALWKACEEGEALLKMKRAATVQSVGYGNEAGKQTNGYHKNTQEDKLLSIEEELIKQQKRIIELEKFKEEMEQDKKILESFIDLIPNPTALTVVTRHFLLGEKYCDIARDLCYSEVYIFVKRAADDLALILMYSL
jgi:hypothetical protein